jgi:hypothetical protein
MRIKKKEERKKKIRERERERKKSHNVLHIYKMKWGME